MVSIFIRRRKSIYTARRMKIQTSTQALTMGFRSLPELVSWTAGDAPISPRLDCSHRCGPRQNLSGRRASRSEKDLWRRTRTPALPPAGEVAVAEAAGESSQRKELGSGHPGDGRRRGRADGGSSTRWRRDAARRRSGIRQEAALVERNGGDGNFGKFGSNLKTMSSLGLNHLAHWAFLRWEPNPRVRHFGS
jgi:hypothetical protein